MLHPPERGPDLYAIDDLSERAHIFRDKIVEEFRLNDELRYAGGGESSTSHGDPKFSTTDLFSPGGTSTCCIANGVSPM